MKILTMQFILVTGSTLFIICMIFVNSINTIPHVESPEDVEQNSITTEPNAADEKHMVSLFGDNKEEISRQPEFKIYPSVDIKSLSAEDINNTMVKIDHDL